MTITKVQIQEFMNVFSGSKHNFGEHRYGKELNSKGKLKGTSRTIKNTLLTVEEYTKHLNGKIGLGIIPINENNRCKFSVIDVDIYGTEWGLYIDAIEKGGFPLIPFKSKSGGLHIYMFLKEETKVKDVLNVMKKFSRLLSIDFLVRNKKNEIPEIFPKQKVLRPGEKGSWINIPYFNCTDTKQCAIKNGKELSLDDALLYIKKKQTTLEEVEEFLNELNYNDAPPCLQNLYILNPFDGNSSRNNFLFSFGVYLKKKDENSFEQDLLEINNGLKDPLTEHEVEKTILQSLRKKDYVYRCSENPCVDFCNKKECKLREYGIGKNDGYFSSIECGQLYQYKMSQPYYEWEVKLQGQEEFKRLVFKTEEEIIKQDTFLKLCMRELYELPSKLKQSEWFNKVNQALKEIEIIEIDTEDDTSPLIILRNSIIEFLTGRAMAKTKEEIFHRKVYFENGNYLFRKDDLMNFLEDKRILGRYVTPNEIHSILRKFNCISKRISVGSGRSRQQARVMLVQKKDLGIVNVNGVFMADFSALQSKEEF